MCEICRKSYCPTVCPNSYSPRGRRKRGAEAEIKRRFFVLRSIGGDAPIDTVHSEVNPECKNALAAREDRSHGAGHDF